MESLYSTQMPDPAPSERLTFTSSIGRRTWGGTLQHLVHQRQAVRGGGGEGPDAGGGRTEAMLMAECSLSQYEIGVQLPVVYEIGDLLDYYVAGVIG